MTKQVVVVLGGTGQQGGGVVDALFGAGRFAVRVASRNPAGEAAWHWRRGESRWSRPISSIRAASAPRSRGRMEPSS
jgi:hypothetical protein